jgi:hypothetical protein
MQKPPGTKHSPRPMGAQGEVHRMCSIWMPVQLSGDPDARRA